MISVGDETTLNLINAGIKPYLAVCDFKIKRARISKADRNKIISAFGSVRRVYKNPAGTLSSLLLDNAAEEIKKGGLIRIIGEEDITALVFMLCAGRDYLVLYGQPDKGLVAVEPEKNKLKKRIKKLLGTSRCLSS